MLWGFAGRAAEVATVIERDGSRRKSVNTSLLGAGLVSDYDVQPTPVLNGAPRAARRRACPWNRPTNTR